MSPEESATAQSSLPEVVRAMLTPSFFPHKPPFVRLVQTHISYVILAPPLVYKIKKPVCFRFLDFSTRELRRHYCEEEIRLNRRLAPHVYRRVVALVRQGEEFRIVAASEVQSADEYAVEMEFLPDDLRLDTLLLSQRVREDFVTEVAGILANFHRRAASGPEIARYGAPDQLIATWEENFADTEAFRDELVSAHDDDRIREFVKAFLRDNEYIFRRRQSEGRVRDGHGDLHADHVYATHPPAIIDCIEFSARLRSCDLVSDVAFLAMDFEFYGRRDLHDRFLLAYNQIMQDHDLPRLLPFYKCYRAYVRGKVEGLKSRETDVPESERTSAAEVARRRFTLAYRYTWEPLRAIVAVAGLSGTGKSTLAALLAERTGFAWFRSDAIRKEIVGWDAKTPARSTYRAGIYTSDLTSRTYREMCSRAVTSFERGRGAIVDATFLRREQRDELRALAEKVKAPLLFVWCTCPEETVRQRIEARVQNPEEVSDADWNIYLHQRAEQEIPGSDEPDVLCLDTSQPPLQSAVQVEDCLLPRAVPVPLLSPLAPKLPPPLP